MPSQGPPRPHVLPRLQVRLVESHVLDVPDLDRLHCRCGRIALDLAVKSYLIPVAGSGLVIEEI